MIECKIHGLQESTATNKCLRCLTENRCAALNRARADKSKKRKELLSAEQVKERHSLRSMIVFNQRKKHSKTLYLIE